MNSLNAKHKLKTAAFVVSTAILAVGCTSTDHHARYSANQAPLASTDQAGGEYYGASMGGTGSSYQTQAGGGGSAQANQSAQNMVIPLEQEQLVAGTQQINGGGVRLRKVVTTE